MKTLATQAMTRWGRRYRTYRGYRLYPRLPDNCSVGDLDKQLDRRYRVIHVAICEVERSGYGLFMPGSVSETETKALLDFRRDLRALPREALIADIHRARWDALRETFTTTH